jgi:putative sterol carrier protein
MTEIFMTGENMLVEKVEVKTKSEFINTADSSRSGVFYIVRKSGDDAKYDEGETVMLKAGSYDQVIIDGTTYLHVENQHVIATATLEK